jgi:hypothetical protein
MNTHTYFDLCNLYGSINCLHILLSVKTSIEPYNKLKILMIKIWIVLKLIPSHDLNKLWLKLKLISFSSDVTDTLHLHFPF